MYLVSNSKAMKPEANIYYSFLFYHIGLSYDLRQRNWGRAVCRISFFNVEVSVERGMEKKRFDHNVKHFLKI